MGHCPLRKGQGGRARRKERLSVCFRASASPCGTEAPGSPSAALFAPNPASCSAQALPGISCAGKLESDPWQRAWSPWQLRLYYRGLHPAWRTFDLKQGGRKPRRQSWEQGAQGCSRRPRDGKRGPVSPAGRPGCAVGVGRRGHTSMVSLPDCFPLSAAGQVSFPGPN